MHAAHVRSAALYRAPRYRAGVRAHRNFRSRSVPNMRAPQKMNVGEAGRASEHHDADERKRSHELLHTEGHDIKSWSTSVRVGDAAAQTAASATSNIDPAQPRDGQTNSRVEAARADIIRRLEIADTDDVLTLHEQQGGDPMTGYNARLISAGRRLVVGKAMMPRLGRDSVLFQHLSLDLLASVGCAVPTVPSMSGEWQVRGAFHHGEQYEYRMWLTEHDDGTVAGRGSFHEHPLATTFVITRGLVVMCDDADTGQRAPAHADRSQRQPMLHMRQESQEFVNLCSLVLSPDRSHMMHGEWMQLDLTSDAEAWAQYQASPFTVPKPQPATEDFAVWGWWGARRVLDSEGASKATTIRSEPKSSSAIPNPGVIGTPRQWVAGAPLRRPPACIADPVAAKARWADPDPDPTATLGARQRGNEREDKQARRRRREIDEW